MDDEELMEIVIPYTAVKHSKWTFIVLAADLAACMAKDIAETLETATTVLGQHRQHKINEDTFFDIMDRGM